LKISNNSFLPGGKGPNNDRPFFWYDSRVKTNPALRLRPESGVCLYIAAYKLLILDSKANVYDEIFFRIFAESVLRYNKSGRQKAP